MPHRGDQSTGNLTVSGAGAATEPTTTQPRRQIWKFFKWCSAETGFIKCEKLTAKKSLSRRSMGTTGWIETASQGGSKTSLHDGMQAGRCVDRSGPPPGSRLSVGVGKCKKGLDTTMVTDYIREEDREVWSIRQIWNGPRRGRQGDFDRKLPVAWPWGRLPSSVVATRGTGRTLHARVQACTCKETGPCFHSIWVVSSLLVIWVAMWDLGRKGGGESNHNNRGSNGLSNAKRVMHVRV